MSKRDKVYEYAVQELQTALGILTLRMLDVLEAKGITSKLEFGEHILRDAGPNPTLSEKIVIEIARGIIKDAQRTRGPKLGVIDGGKPPPGNAA